MKETSKWWWIGGNYNTSNSSPWLNSTLSELDSKTKEILRVIDEVDDEADSYVKRAKIYHEKKPELIAMIEDLYRSHRSLAYKHDLLIKTSSLNPNRHNSPTCDEVRSELCESEVDDGEGDEEDQIVVFGGDVIGETMKEEVVRLREENRAYKEKRELTRLFVYLVRVCFRAPFASFSIGKCLILFFNAFAFYFLRRYFGYQ